MLRRDTFFSSLLALAASFGALEPAAGQQADDPFAKEKAIYFSDKVLREAVAEIAKMKESELRAFVRYLSECADEADSDVSKHACSAALASYEIEFGQSYSVGRTRPLDDLIYARTALHDRTLAVRSSEPSSTSPLALAQEAMKIGKIESALDEAAHNRFFSLKAGQ